MSSIQLNSKFFILFFLDYYAAKIRFYTEQTENIPYFCIRKRTIIMLTTIFLVFFLTIVASFIQRVTGFGFGIFVMMFFPYYIISNAICTCVYIIMVVTASAVISNYVNLIEIIVTF